MHTMIAVLWCGATACTWVPFGVCGNGLVEDGEACDDGNDIPTDACTNACEAAVCGDGIVWDGQEGCDLGPDNVETGTDTGTCGIDCQPRNIDVEE